MTEQSTNTDIPKDTSRKVYAAIEDAAECYVTELEVEGEVRSTVKSSVSLFASKYLLEAMLRHDVIPLATSGIAEMLTTAGTNAVQIFQAKLLEAAENKT